MTTVLGNYEDSKSAWGYITLCQECAKIIQEEKGKSRKYSYKHIYPDKPITGFPAAEVCEACGRRSGEPLL